MDTLDLNISLRQIAKNNGYGDDDEFDNSVMDGFAQYKADKFATKILIFNNQMLSSITAAECDYLFSCLILDINLHRTNQNTWNLFADYLIATIKYLLQSLPTTDNYFSQYAISMEKREFYLPLHENIIRAYNTIVKNWRFF